VSKCYNNTAHVNGRLSGGAAAPEAATRTVSIPHRHRNNSTEIEFAIATISAGHNLLRALTSRTAKHTLDRLAGLIFRDYSGSLVVQSKALEDGGKRFDGELAVFTCGNTGEKTS
jgi:hypothetical protein